jgi:hypothetical protein
VAGRQIRAIRLLRLGNYDYGAAFWANAVYIHLVMLTSSVLLIQFLGGTNRHFRSQMLALLNGLLHPDLQSALPVRVESPKLRP